MITNINSKKLELNIIHINDILKAIYLIINNDIKSGTYCLKNKKNVKIRDLIKSINIKSKIKLKTKFLKNDLIKPQKNLLKTLPKWKADITIKNRIEKMFLK